MKINKYFFAVLILLSPFFISGCKSSEKTGEKEKRVSQKKQLEAIRSAKFKSFYFEGIKDKSLENYGEAMESFQKCLKMAPDHAATLYQAGIVSREAGNYEDALNYLSRAVENDGSNHWYMAEYGEILAKMRKFDEAAKVYSDLIEKKPNELRFYYNLGNTYIFSEELEKAIEVYEDLENKTGFNEDITKQRYKLQKKLGNDEKAEREVRRLIDHFPRNPEYRGMLAGIFRDRGEPEKAAEVFEKLKELDDDNPLIHLSLADFYDEAGKTDKAFKERETAFAYPELDIDNKVKILMNYYKASRPGDKLVDRSYRLLEIMEEVHDDDPKTYAIYGDFLMRDDRTKEAREKYRKSIALDSSRFMIWNRVLMINSELNDIEAMQTESAAAMDLFPAQPMPYLMNGLAHLQKENYSEAAMSLEQGKNLVVDNPAMQMQFYSSLGDAYYQNGKHGQAWLNYERALRIDPENDYVLNNYAYFLSLQKEQLDKARNMSKRTVKRNPNSPTYLDTYGWVLYQSGMYKEAKEHLERALQNGGDTQSEILEHYGDVMFQLNNTEKAVEYWEKAKNAGDASDDIDQKIQTRSLLE